jgi:hypothetical protein
MGTDRMSSYQTPDRAIAILDEMRCIERHLDRNPKRVIISESVADELHVPSGRMWPKRRGSLWGVPLYVRPDVEVT